MSNELLDSIDERLKALVTIATDIAEHLGVYTPQTQAAQSSTVPQVASDRDLDSQYGNPEVKAKDPRDWTGPTMKGRRFSECPAAYLLLVADRLDYFAQNEDDPKKARYDRLDASRARGWAERKAKGWTPPPEEPAAFTAPALTDDDIPF